MAFPFALTFISRHLALGIKSGLLTQHIVVY
jgi:hypothetical protein